MHLAVRGRGKWFPQCASDGPVAANALCTNTFSILDKNILQFAQIYFGNLRKYILAICTTTFWQFAQIHLGNLFSLVCF